ncbi:ATP-binding protein [Streptomyces lydicus]|uniref:ATP-binding protein n=1 Tax=Streptomyces lydicus TaxID=47763 RepID=UPI0037A33899
MALGEIGRGSETARLRALLDQSRRGRGAVDLTVVRGEPGAGKSALLDAFGEEAAAAGFRVAAVRGTGLGERPYAAVHRLIAQLRPGDGQFLADQYCTPDGDPVQGWAAVVQTASSTSPCSAASSRQPPSAHPLDTSYARGLAAGLSCRVR